MRRTFSSNSRPSGSKLVVHRRAGFTLLEVFFASIISLLLLGSLLAALDLYRRISTVGRDDVERAQVTRTVLRMMIVDLRSASLPSDDSTEEEEAQVTGLTVTSEDEMLVSYTEPAEAYSGGGVGIVGDSASIVIHTARPARDVLAMLAPGTTEPAAISEMQSVSYFLAYPGDSGLPGAVGSLVAETGGDGVGLARLSGDRMAIEFADTTSNLDALAAETRLLAPEITYLQFRYFDGLAWYDMWDSQAYGALPNAVEITLGLREMEQIDDEALQTTAVASPAVPEDSTTLIRHVVALPTAEPYIETTTTVAP